MLQQRSNLARMYLNNKRGLGRTGAPDMRGVAPGANVLVKVGGALVGIPRLILAKGGMAVLVSRAGRVIVAEPSCQYRGAAQEGEAGDKKEKMNGETHERVEQTTNDQRTYVSAEHAAHSAFPPC